jgi:hypothetical protein
VEWFERQAGVRGGELRDGPTPDRLSELGRGHELHGLAARIWDGWEPPPLRVDGADMPALIRRWQDGDATSQEAKAAVEWSADYQQWREQLLAGGRYLNAEDLDAVRRYEAALAAAGAAGAVVAGKLSAGRDASGFHGQQWEREHGKKARDALPLAGQPGPSVGVEVAETKTLFAHSDEIHAQYRSAEDHRRDWFVDAKVGTSDGLTNDGLTSKLTGSVELGWRRGAIPIDGLPGSTEYQVLAAGVNADAGASLDPDKVGLHAEAGAEATLAKISNDKLIEEKLGPLTASAGGELSAGAGATAKGGVYIEDGALVVDAKAGAKLGLGGKVNVNLELDLEELVDLVTPEARSAGGGGAVSGSF